MCVWEYIQFIVCPFASRRFSVLFFLSRGALEQTKQQKAGLAWPLLLHQLIGMRETVLDKLEKH